MIRKKQLKQDIDDLNAQVDSISRILNINSNVHAEAENTLARRIEANKKNTSAISSRLGAIRPSIIKALRKLASNKRIDSMSNSEFLTALAKALEEKETK